mgnify:CR=1 FL=1
MILRLCKLLCVECWAGGGGGGWGGFVAPLVGGGGGVSLVPEPTFIFGPVPINGFDKTGLNLVVCPNIRLPLLPPDLPKGMPIVLEHTYISVPIWRYYFY